MKKKTLLITAGLLAAGFTSFAQKQYNVLNWKADYSLNTYLIQQMHRQYDQRAISFNKALTSPQALLAYQADCKKRYVNLLGNMPKAALLNVQLTGSLSQQGYRVDKLIYESFANHHVTASLYVPEGKGKFPAVLIMCGHEAEAKATVSYQQTAILLAKSGFEVLMVDPISQGERYQLTDDQGKPLTRGGTTEHTLLNAGANLVGTSTVAYELWDNVRSLDYLLSRPEVDANRVGCLGNSGGATQAGYLMAYDSRIKAAALCSYVLNSEHSLELTGPPDGCVEYPGEAKAGLQDVDYYTMFAPKPVIILAGRYDFVDYSHVTTAYSVNKKVYTLLHQADKISLFTVDDGHGISKPKREAAITWFNRWLRNDNKPVTEGKLTTLSSQELNSTMSGQVNTSFNNEVTIQQQNIIKANDLAAQRQRFMAKPEAIRLQTIANICGINTATAQITPEAMGEIQKDGYTIHKFILRRQGEVPLPCLLIYPKQVNANSKIIIGLSQQGKGKLADSVSFMQNYLKAGHAILLADLRGMGEMTDRAEFNDPKFYNSEYRNAMLALNCGRSLTGQRTTDVLTLLEFIKHDTQLSRLPVQISASGSAAVAALHAAVFNKSIQGLDIYNTPHSYYELLQHPLMKEQYSYVIPDVLSYYNLPDLVKMAGTTKVSFH